ncbi:tRNA (32-2'-O)-methyltransferase regulator THADA-like [Urocitellus parryii]
MSYRLSAVVSPVIQSSSPEGRIPMDTDSGKEGKTCDVTAQMVLVCCWRSMKEVALLLGTLCQLLPMQSMPESSDGLLTEDQVKEIGDYFKQHLLQSRHRGAFELAYTGFVKLTEILNRMTGREFFSRFPELYPFLLKQLEAVASTLDSDLGQLDHHPSMYLLLLVLERLYPSLMDGTSSALSMAPFVPFIMRCGHSPIYRSREMAARALVPFVMLDQIPSTIRTLLATLPNCTDQCFWQNHIHGALLQVFHLLKAYTDSKHRTSSDFLQELTDITVCTKAKLWLAKRYVKNPR